MIFFKRLKQWPTLSPSLLPYLPSQFSSLTFPTQQPEDESSSKSINRFYLCPRQDLKQDPLRSRAINVWSLPTSLTPSLIYVFLVIIFQYYFLLGGQVLFPPHYLCFHIWFSYRMSFTISYFHVAKLPCREASFPGSLPQIPCSNFGSLAIFSSTLFFSFIDPDCETCRLFLPSMIYNI